MMTFVYALILSTLALPIIYIILKRQMGGGSVSLDECLDTKLELEQDVAGKVQQLREAIEVDTLGVLAPLPEPDHLGVVVVVEKQWGRRNNSKRWQPTTQRNT